jgi:hypothetical protein
MGLLPGFANPCKTAIMSPTKTGVITPCQSRIDKA